MSRAIRSALPGVLLIALPACAGGGGGSSAATAGGGGGGAGSAVLSWTANTEPTLAGYKVYFGTASSSYGAPADVGNVATHTVTGLQSGARYFFAVTAYNTSSSESAPSEEVQKDVQ